jgi:hypothetical protein
VLKPIWELTSIVQAILAIFDRIGKYILQADVLLKKKLGRLLQMLCYVYFSPGIPWWIKLHKKSGLFHTSHHLKVWQNGGQNYIVFKIDKIFLLLVYDDKVSKTICII